MSPTSISIPSGDAPAPLVERVQDFVSKHKTAILIASAAAVTAAGIAYLHYSSTSSINGNKKKPSTRGTKKKKQDGKVDGPILEERKPKVEDGAVGGLLPYSTC
jgi:import receptor subunit TOM70